MAKIHMVLQGKGGVGKSFIASTLAQHKLAKGKKLLCIDTDPVNATFNGFKKLNVRQVNVMSGDEIDARRFDELIELIAKAEGDVIIDNGASTFVPMSHYLISNQIPALLHDLDHELVVHTVITGSQALLDTLNGFSQLIKQFPKEVLFVVWLNPYWGEITMDGKQFEEMRVYLDNKARVSAIIRIPDYKADTFGKDLSQILQAKLTFSEALENKTLPIMVRQRLTIIKKQLFTNIENVAAVFDMTRSDSDYLHKVIERVAAKHGIALSNDDPVLMVHTLNEILLEDNARAHQLLLNDFRSVLEESIGRLESANTRTGALPSPDNKNILANRQFLQRFIESADQEINTRLIEKISAISALCKYARQAAIINLMAATVFMSAILVALVVF